jgi:hypothetical protein
LASVLTIAGSTVNRPGSHVLINRLTHSLDVPDCLEFVELNATLPGTYAPEQAVTLDVDGTREFTGWIFGRSIGGIGVECPSVGYRCFDLRFGAALIAVTASDGTGIMRFNLPTTDDYYQSTAAGQSIGDILAAVFAQHSTQLGAIGISTDATTTSQLAALTVVTPPGEPVYIQGNSLWMQCLQLVQQWYASKYCLWINPLGKIRCIDTTTLTAQTLTLDTDPVILDSISEDTDECYTQVVLRGAADVEPYYASLLEGTLIDPNTGANEAAWNIYDFLYPPNAFSTGTINSQTSTTVTITSDSTSEHWGVNYWSGIQAQIAVVNPAITGLATLTGAEWKTIISNTALTAGGTSVITVDSPFANTGFTRYAIRGQPAASSDVYRKYTFKWRYAAQHLVKKFAHSVPWSPSQGTIGSTLFPQAVIVSPPQVGSASFVQWPLDFEVVPFDGTNDGYIRFYEPTVDVVAGNGGQLGQALITGGASVTKPTDIIVVVPYSRGALQAIEPLSGGTPTYSGTAYTRFGIQRPLYREYPDWIDKGNLAAMQTLASQILDTVSNVVQEGSLTYLGKYSAALVGGNWPLALNIAKATGTTGFESMAAPVRTMTLEYPQQGAPLWVTRLSFSTRRQQYSGDRLYVHPAYAYQGGFFAGAQGMQGGQLNMVGAAGYTPEALGLDRSAMELSGYDPSAMQEEPRRQRRRRAGSDMLSGADVAKAPDAADTYRADTERATVDADQAENQRRYLARQEAKRPDISRQPRPGELVYGGQGAGGLASQPASDADRIAKDQALSAKRLQARRDRQQTAKLAATKRKQSPRADELDEQTGGG